MIRLHYLNRSRAKRILWLLRELGEPYEVVRYQRDAQTSLAPAELKKIHPLGKSPVIEIEGLVLAESGAITEFLIDRFAPERLAPARGTPAFAEYLQWIHFAESSLMLPLLLRLFASREQAPVPFLSAYAEKESHAVLSYLNDALIDKRYLVEERLTGADMMMSFVVDVLQSAGALAQYPHIERYAQQLNTHESWRDACVFEQS